MMMNVWQQLMKGDLSPEQLKLFYNVSLFVRLLVVFFGVSYLNPDQFKSTEAVAGDVFGFEVEKAWEFDKDHATRSIFTSAIVAGIPYMILKTLSIFINLVNAFTLFYLPRIFLFAASFIIDYIVWDLSGKETTALATLGSSWVTLIFLLSPLSNTVETIILAIFIYLSLNKKTFSWNDYALLGVVFAVGIFNSNTFLIFSFSVLLYLVYNEFLEEKGVKKNGWQVLISGLGAGFAVMSAILIVIDSVYFGSLSVSFGDKPFRWLDLLDPRFHLTFIPNLFSMSFNSFSWTATPINSLLYTNEENVADESHWRLTHSIVNMPLLLGPLYIIALLPYYNWLDDKLGEQLGQTTKKSSKGKRKIPKASELPPQVLKIKKAQEVAQSARPKQLIQDIVNIGIIASGVVVLSFAPQQEMRFLVPLLVPFVLLGHKGLLGSESNRLLQVGWVLFNVIMLITVGMAHQGGMVPSMLGISKVATANEQGEPITNHLVYYHTLTPSRHLLTISKQAKPKFSVHDLKDSPLSELKKRILRIKESISYFKDDKIFIIAPSTVDLESMQSDLTLKRSFWPHLSVDSFPTSIEGFQKNLTLSVYEWNTPTA